MRAAGIEGIVFGGVFRMKDKSRGGMPAKRGEKIPKTPINCSQPVDNLKKMMYNEIDK